MFKEKKILKKGKEIRVRIPAKERQNERRRKEHGAQVVCAAERLCTFVYARACVACSVWRVACGCMYMYAQCISTCVV